MEATLDSPNSGQKAQVMSVQDWVITFLIMAIPLVGFVMLFVWAFGSDTNQNKANFAKGALIWMAIVVVLYIIIFAVFGAAFLSAMGSFS